MVTSRVLTGRGADIILIDDPSKPEEALSKTLRQASIAKAASGTIGM